MWAKPSVFAGYSNVHKGYRLFDLHTQSYFVSRDVVFYEHIFPLAHLLDSFVYPISSNSDVSSFPVSNGQFVFPDSSPSDAIHTSPNNPSSSDSVDISSSTLPSSVPADITPSLPPLRKSTRQKCIPGYLQQYHCQLVSHLVQSNPKVISDTPFPLSSSLEYDKVSPAHKLFCLFVSTNHEPQFFHQAIKHQHWREAMSTKIQALENNHTWVFTDLPPNNKIIGCKWVYNVTTPPMAQYCPLLALSNQTSQ